MHIAIIAVYTKKANTEKKRTNEGKKPVGQWLSIVGVFLVDI